MSIILASPPAVIDEDLCRKCIGSLKTGAAGKEYEAKKDSIAFRDVQLLRLSYQNLLKMDNLVGFDKLVKLQLDNNIIEKIENLSHLTSLTQLDLSFNNISEIAGLDSLTSLTSLSLFSNRITQLGGMDTLSKLQVLSVGNNLLSQLDNIMYLRPFEELQAVNLVGNPFCQEEEYRRYVLAHLKHVKYLDYRLVDQQAVSSAKEQYQDELLELDETEGNKETQAVADEEKAKRVALHLSANMRGMDTIFEDIMMKGDGDFGERLRSLLWSQVIFGL
jgi:Leucine-rich repeat (LRR) protein